jgi:hypothetical protein
MYRILYIHFIDVVCLYNRCYKLYVSHILYFIYAHQEHTIVHKQHYRNKNE